MLEKNGTYRCEQLETQLRSATVVLDLVGHWNDMGIGAGVTTVCVGVSSSENGGTQQWMVIMVYFRENPNRKWMMIRGNYFHDLGNLHLNTVLIYVCE